MWQHHLDVNTNFESTTHVCFQASNQNIIIFMYLNDFCFRIVLYLIINHWFIWIQKTKTEKSKYKHTKKFATGWKQKHEFVLKNSTGDNTSVISSCDFKGFNLPFIWSLESYKSRSSWAHILSIYFPMGMILFDSNSIVLEVLI